MLWRLFPSISCMAIGAGSYFFLVEGNAAGLAIFFSLLFDQANLFLNIGLYIWVGMLLRKRVWESWFFIFSDPGTCRLNC